MRGLIYQLILIITSTYLVLGQNSSSTTIIYTASSDVTTAKTTPAPEIAKPLIGTLDSILNKAAVIPEVIPVQAISDRVQMPEVLIAPNVDPSAASNSSNGSTIAESPIVSRNRWRIPPLGSPEPLPDRVNPILSVGREDPMKINPVVDPTAPQVIPMITVPQLPPLAATSTEELPDDVKMLKMMVTNRDEKISSLNAAMSQLQDKCGRPGPIGIMPPGPICPPPTNDMGCSVILGAKDDEIQNLRKRMAYLETLGKQPKRQIDVYIQRSKPVKKGKFQTKSSTANPSAADCESALNYEKTVTTALQTGVIERDVQITNLQESLKNAEERATVIQNREINACNLKMKRVEMDLQMCKDKVERSKYSTNNEDSEDDESSYDDEEDNDEDDSDDPGIRSIVYRLLISSAIKNRHPFVYLNGLPIKFNRRFENKVPVITLGNNEYYFQNSSRVNWKVASNNCEKRNMRLAAIESEEESAMISAIIGNSNYNYWTSGRDNYGKGDFQWSSIKKQFNFTNWAPDQQLNGDPKRQCVSTGPANDAAAALLDELMGRNRNILPDDVHNKISWDDNDICKLHLVKLCPHELFVNTRADLGPCPKIHDDEMRKEYAKQSTYRKQQYEDEFIRFCQGMLNEVERKIAKGKVRLALSGRSADPDLQQAPESEKAETEEIRELTEKINKYVEEAEKAGIMGNVDEAQEQNGYSWTNELAQAQEKQMEVCETCGAFLIVGDAQQRIDDHLQGKQHMGYARLKDAVDEILETRRKAKEEREKRREEERKERARAQKVEEKLREAEREVRRMNRGSKDEDEHRHKKVKPKHRSRSRSPHHKGNRRDHDRHEKSRQGRRSPDYRRDYRDDRNRNDRNAGRNYKDSSRRGS
ncbi:Hypothetical predicted protein [Cloeon dipterum]|uniref:C-type lectin domain-containing protein n=1 Tax=Cloeon dipterum TaxID=197152 RepID=A0A8S1DFK1_9INSE|nr:Hypothetical predicted protein [Cloeon dipterum]